MIRKKLFQVVPFTQWFYLPESPLLKECTGCPMNFFFRISLERNVGAMRSKRDLVRPDIFCCEKLWKSPPPPMTGLRHASNFGMETYRTNIKIGVLWLLIINIASDFQSVPDLSLKFDFFPFWGAKLILPKNWKRYRNRDILGRCYDYCNRFLIRSWFGL